MKYVLAILLVDTDKCIREYDSCRPEEDAGDLKKVCVKDKKTDRYFEFDSSCERDVANCLCTGCVEKAHESKCKKEEDDEPSDDDNGLDTCIKKYKKCEDKKDSSAESFCGKDKETGKSFRMANDCQFEGTNCMCNDCVEKTDDSNCDQDNSGGS